jgi:hypothetical protein
MLAASEEQKSLLEAQIQCERSKQVATGLQPGTRPSKRLHTRSPIETTNCDNGEITFCLSFQPDKLEHTTNSLPSTRQSELKLEEDRQSCLPTATNSHTSTQPSFFQMASRLDQLGDRELATRKLGLPPPTSVDDSTALADVVVQWKLAIIDMPVPNANSWGMGKKAALSWCEASYGLHPKYLRYNVWHAQDRGEGNVQLEFPI